jgi:NitT/TauT family transport system substrate-binding protein
MRVLRLFLLTLCASVALSYPAAAQDVVRITNIGRGYYAGPLYVAVREKLFEKHGLKPDVTFVKGGSLALQSVLSKEADFGILTYEHVITAAAQGRSLMSIFNITTRPLNNVIVSNALYEAASGKSLEERVRALKGKKIGTPSPGGSGEKMLGVLAKRYGLKLPGDIELVYLGADAGAYVGALQAKLIDAAMPFEPAGVMVEQQKLGHTLINLMDGKMEEFRDLVFMTVTAHPDTLKDRPELARKMAAVFAEAQAILLDPVRGKKIMGEEFAEMAPETNERAYEVVRQIWSPDGKMDLAGAKKVFDFIQPGGGRAIDYDKTFTNAFLPKAQ